MGFVLKRAKFIPPGTPNLEEGNEAVKHCFGKLVRWDEQRSNREIRNLTFEGS